MAALLLSFSILFYTGLPKEYQAGEALMSHAPHVGKIVLDSTIPENDEEWYDENRNNKS
jgi:hypothetical protein